MLTSEADIRKRWKRVVSFLLFLVFILSGALGAIIPEIFGQLFGNLRIGYPEVVDRVTSRSAVVFFMSFPVWGWLVAAIVGLMLTWALIVVRMASSGGDVPVKTTMMLALMPIAVLGVEVFCFIAPTQEILAETGSHEAAAAEHGESVEPLATDDAASEE